MEWQKLDIVCNICTTCAFVCFQLFPVHSGQALIILSLSDEGSNLKEAQI